MKRIEIIQYLKQKILSGELAPGSFLPHRSELIRQCEASNVTVQHAVNQLIADGFLRSCGSKGVMISPTPPHKSRFAILLPASNWPEKPGFDTKWIAIKTVLEDLKQNRSGMSIVRYHVGKETHQHADEYKHLLEALHNSLLAGVIIPTSLPDALLKPLEGFPIVQFEPRERLIRAVSFNHDYVELTKLAVEKLRQCGAKRIAVLMNSELNPFFVRAIEEFLTQKPYSIREEWIQAVSCTSREVNWTGRLLKLLFHSEQQKKPDGLVVLNENLLSATLDAVNAMGYSIGRDIHICCHCNLPSKLTPSSPVHFVAMDWHYIFQKTLWCLRHFNELDNSFFEKEFLLPPKLVQPLIKTHDQSAFPWSENVNKKEKIS